MFTAMQANESADKRELLLESALKLFNRDGFEKTPTSRISKDAGVATGLLFHYFPTKEDLIGAVYLRCKDSMIAAMLAGFEPSASVDEALERLFRNYLSWTRSSKEEFLFFQQFSDSSFIGERTRESARERCAPLFEMLGEGMKRGIVREARVDYLFELVASIMVKTARYLIDNPGMPDEAEFIDCSYGMFRDCLLVKPRRP
jgi:AcrR family transcriptional regulator